MAIVHMDLWTFGPGELKSQQGMIGKEHDQKILEKSTGNDWSRT